MRYFPLSSDRFEHQFGIRALPAGAAVVEATDLYRGEIVLKRQLLDSNREHYFCAQPGTEAAQREAFEFVRESAAFLGETRNERLQEPLRQDDRWPLLAIARHVQEDLLIVRGDRQSGYPMVAGVVCFPSGWCVADKLGQSMLQIHEPVPEFDSVLNEPTERLMANLKPGRPVWRMNWGIRPSNRLDQSPLHEPELSRERTKVTSESAGRRCFFRVERQTLARLPHSGNVLFTIHTHQSALEDLSREQKRRIRGVLETCPEQTLAYKGILPIRDSIVSFLDEQNDS